MKERHYKKEMENKKKYKIGLGGLETSKLNFLKKKFKNIEFYSLNKNNFFKKFDLDSIVIFTEGSLSGVIDSFFVDKKYKLFKKLQWLHLSRAGLDEHANEIKKIKFPITCGKIIQGPNVSEHCIAILMYLSRRLQFVDNKKVLAMNRPIELYKKSALIVGCGGVGTNIAEKLNAFGMEVSVSDVRYVPLSYYIKEFYLCENLKEIVNKFDVVINSSSLTKSTKNLFDKKIFSKMKNNSIFINVSRGKCVKTEDLLYYLKKNKFLGVGLDVVDPEPLPQNHALRKFPNFFYTDHTAGWSDTLDRRFKLILDNISRFINKGKLINLIKS